MKKFLSLMLALVLSISICACGKKALTLESLADMYVSDGDTRASFSFEDEKMNVEIIHYINSASSPTGKVAGKKDTYSKDYTLEGTNYVIVEGTKYYYEIDEENNKVKFSVKFMDLAKEFHISYIK